MKVLFIGGTGVISSACSQRAVAKGMDLYHLNRGITSLRKIAGVKTIQADIRDLATTRQALKGHEFDVVVDWIAFEPQHIHHDIELFAGITKQFVFISSASAYQTPPEQLPITEDTPLHNPFWEYSRLKMACEEVLQDAYRNNGFPYTIVRPSHTYDQTMIPLLGKYTTLQRMKEGQPVVVIGDGTSIWTLTHHQDFAVGFVGLLGRKEAIGEAYQITSDEWLSWNNIYHLFARELGVEPKLVHVPSKVVARYAPVYGDGLLGDKSHSMIFDNSKIKSLVPEYEAKIPFRQGVKEIVDWFEKHPGGIDASVNEFMDRLVSDFDWG